MKTGRQVQTGLFLESLRQQFDQMSNSSDKDSLYISAQDYLGEGFSCGECVELLVSDGFNPDMARSCASSVYRESSKKKSMWGFEFEDAQGSTVTSFDMQKTVLASSKEEAKEAAEVLVADAGLDYCRITRIFKA